MKQSRLFKWNTLLAHASFPCLECSCGRIWLIRADSILTHHFTNSSQSWWWCLKQLWFPIQLPTYMRERLFSGCWTWHVLASRLTSWCTIWQRDLLNYFRLLTFILYWFSWLLLSDQIRLWLVWDDLWRLLPSLTSASKYGDWVGNSWHILEGLSS